jgi:two-component system NtrC family sensor kinase
LPYLLRGILYVGVYVVLAAVFRGHSLAQSIFGNVGLLIPAITFCFIIVRRRSEWRGVQRLYWDTCLLGMILWSIGHLGWAFSDLVLHQVSWVQWHALFSLCGGLGLLVALLARPHLGPRENATGAIAVTLVSYGVLGGFVYAYFVLVPGVVPTSATGAERTMLTLVQIQRLLLLLATGAAAYVAARTAWAVTYRLLFIGATAGFFLRVITSLAIVGGSYHSGSLFDLAWIIPYLFYSWAALEAPRSPLESAARVPSTGVAASAALSAIPVLLIPMIGYGLLRVQPLGEPGDSFRVLLTTMTTVVGLGLVTLRLSMQGSELQRTDARLRLLAAATEQTGDLILITKADGAFEHANDACVRALGYSRHELSGLYLQDLLQLGFEATIEHIPAEVREKGVWRGTLLHRRRDGSVFPVSSTVAALKDTEGRIVHYVAVERDITDELRLRDQLVQSERMSAVGELVAGVAHEINNPLQTIVGCVELLLEERKGDDDQARDLHLVRQEAARAGQIVRNLLAFVRRGASDRTSTDLNQIVKATADLRDYHLAQQNIALVVDLHPDALPVLANREEIQQVVLNLLMNAEQAIASGPGAGTIVLKTTSTGASHTLQVTDDGPGIGQDLRGRIFEPFFTTKEVGQGTGLGLSISLGIASSHGGVLELGDSPKGACFKLTLPAQVLAPVPAQVAPAGATGAKSDARLRALIIDDESAIRDLLTRLLDRRGFAVAQAPTAAEGRRLMQQPFDLVLCDVKLGDGSGIDCFHYLRHKGASPSTRFVFITGDTGAIDDMPEAADIAVLAKPFTASDLDRLLAAMQVGV